MSTITNVDWLARECIKSGSESSGILAEAQEIDGRPAGTRSMGMLKTGNRWKTDRYAKNTIAPRLKIVI
jgi:hypothetical protein